MKSPSTSSPVRLTILRIIWAALLIGEGTFLILIIRVLIPNRTVPSQPQPLLIPISFAMCFTTIPITFFIRRLIFNKARQKAGALTIAAYTTGNIIFWAGCDGVAFFGMVVALLNASLWPTIICVAVAMALQVITFPTGMSIDTPTYPPAD